MTTTDHANTTGMAASTTAETPTTRMVTIREAADMVGTTPDAIRGRVERGSLQHVKRDGVRLIPIAELRRAGLLMAGGMVAATSTVSGTTVDATDLLDRLLEAERRVVRAESQRLLLERNSEIEREAMTAELVELRAKVKELEAIASKRKRWFKRTPKAPKM